MTARFTRMLILASLIGACQACSHAGSAGGGQWNLLPGKDDDITHAADFDDSYVGDTERGRRFLVNGDPVSAAREFRGPAMRGDPAAALALAELYAAGKGVTRDPSAALYWYELAAEKGTTEAKVSLGRQLWFGEWLEPDPVAALQWWDTAARSGDKEANYLLGQVYLGGLTPVVGPQPVAVDPARAATFFRKAAESGHRAASACLASLYESGIGVPRDPVSARHWYEKAGDAPDPDTAFEIARFYSRAGGPVQDHQKALFWMRRAAEAGHEQAIRMLSAVEHEARLAEGSLVLFGQPVAIAYRQSVRRALAGRGIMVLDERDDTWYDLYDSRGLWPVTDRLWLGYTLSGAKLASLRYRIPRGDRPDILGRVKTELIARHGPPVRDSEKSAFGGVYAEWQNRDVTIRLLRGDDGNLFVTYHVEPAYGALSREQGVRVDRDIESSAGWTTY
jgi:TPR repeat protein